MLNYVCNTEYTHKIYNWGLYILMCTCWVKTNKIIISMVGLKCYQQNKIK